MKTNLVDGQLFMNKKKVYTIILKDALNSFKEFLNTFSKQSLLIAHDASSNTSHFNRALLNNCMKQDFQKTIVYRDTLPLFKKRFPDRKGERMIKL